MKNVRPELIISGTMSARGVSTAIMATLHSDLLMELSRSRSPDLNRVYLHINDDRMLADSLRWFEQYYGSPEETAEALAKYQGRLAFACVHDDDAQNKAKTVAKIIRDFIEIWPEKEVCVYIDLFRMFKLGCTNGAGMVVPGPVETQEVLADALLDNMIRLRAVGTRTRLEPRK